MPVNMNFIIFIVTLLSSAKFSLAELSNPEWTEFKFRADHRFIDHANYVEKLVGKFVEKIEDKLLSSFHVDELVELKIEVQLHGELHNGTVSLEAGFWNSMESVTTLPAMNKAILLKGMNNISSDIYFNNLTMFYNVAYEFEDGEKGFGVTRLIIPTVTLQTNVTQSVFDKKDIKVDLAIKNQINCKGFTYTSMPYPKAMQIAMKGLQSSETFCEYVNQVITGWELGRFIKQAVEDIGFADVCYYCNKKE